MNYYEHHLGDYAKDAGHLSMIREGAYRRLIDVYYNRERALPLELKECYDLTRCTGRAEREAVGYVLERFFERRADGFHQKRCDEEIARFKAKSENAKASANARWSHTERNANGSANAMRTHSEGNAPSLQSPVPSLQSPEDLPTPTLPAEREGGPLENSQTSRARGSNPRANGANPRSQGTNPRASRDERKSGWEAAGRVWAELLGSGGAKRDQRSQAALDAIGGWQRVRVRSDGEEVRLKREFCEAYVGATA